MLCGIFMDNLLYLYDRKILMDKGNNVYEELKGLEKLGAVAVETDELTYKLNEMKLIFPDLNIVGILFISKSSNLAILLKNENFQYVYVSKDRQTYILTSTYFDFSILPSLSPTWDTSAAKRIVLAREQYQERLKFLQQEHEDKLLTIEKLHSEEIKNLISSNGELMISHLANIDEKLEEKDIETERILRNLKTSINESRENWKSRLDDLAVDVNNLSINYSNDLEEIRNSFYAEIENASKSIEKVSSKLDLLYEDIKSLSEENLRLETLQSKLRLSLNESLAQYKELSSYTEELSNRDIIPSSALEEKESLHLLELKELEDKLILQRNGFIEQLEIMRVSLINELREKDAYYEQIIKDINLNYEIKFNELVSKTNEQIEKANLEVKDAEHRAKTIFEMYKIDEAIKSLEAENKVLKSNNNNMIDIHNKVITALLEEDITTALILANSIGEKHIYDKID